MQSAVFYHPGDVRITESPVPEPGSGEVRLKVLLAGMCSTDRHIVLGHFTVAPPRILGHELTGVVDALGPDVPPEWLGKICGVSPARFCGVCPMCRQGQPQLCQNFECLGNTHDGGFAEYTLVRVEQLVPLGEIAPEEAVWLEPLACVLQALDQVSGERLAGPVLVVGAGVLGKLMVQALKATAAGVQVGVIDPNPSKVEAAKALGADAGWVIPRQGPVPQIDSALQDWASGRLPLIIDTTGRPEAIARALDWAGPRAKILLFGVSDPAARLSISPHTIFAKELTILASSGMTPASFEAAQALLRRGSLNLKALNSPVIGLEALPEHLLGQAAPTAGKVLVQPGLPGQGGNA